MSERSGSVLPRRWKTLEPILEAALDRNASERAAFLDAACGGDVTMRSDLERLLEACERSEAMFSNPGSWLFSPLLREPLERVLPVLGDNYHIVRELGRGGMATVYLADDPKHGRQVAVKVLHDELARRVGRERFLREIGIAARLSHPHILPVHDSGEARSTSESIGGGSVLYYVSPFVAGESLRVRLRREGRLPVSAAVRLAREVAEALDYAHRQGVIHRDIKPGNILLLEGHAVVADFGIARAITRASDDVTRGDAALVLGTPAYMSPEQAAGSRELDGRSDVYSLGVVVYEMLTGERPGGAARIADVASPALEAIVRRALALDPRDRFASAGELAQALTELSSGERPEQSAVAPAGAPALRSGRPRFARALIAAGALAVIAVIAVFAVMAARAGLLKGTTSKNVAAASAPSIVVLPFVNMSADPADEYFSDGMTEELIVALGRVEGLRVVARTSAFQFKGKGGDVREVGERLGVGSVLEGSVRKSGNRIRITAQLVGTSDGSHLWSESYDRDLTDIFAVQEEIARDIASSLRMELAATTPLVARQTGDREAYELYLKGRLAWNQRTRASNRQAIEYFERAIARDSGYALAHSGLAASHVAVYEFEGGFVAEIVARTTAAARRALALDSTLAEPYAVLGLAHLHAWQWREAERAFARALALDPRLPILYEFYSNYLDVMGRKRESLEATRRGLALDPLSAVLAYIVVGSYIPLREFDAALIEANRMLELHPNSPLAHEALGWTLVDAGRPAEAIAPLERSMALGGRWWPLANLGRAYALAGRPRDARRVLDRLLREWGDRAPGGMSIAAVYLALGKRDSAFVWLERDFERRGAKLPFVHLFEAWAPVRGDPRFVRLIVGMGLDPALASLTEPPLRGSREGAPRSDERPRSTSPDGSLVVLPFANMTPNESNEYFSDGLTEEVITRLAAVPQLKVISRTSAMHYKGSNAPIRVIANELNVAHVLEGSVRQDGDKFRVTVQLIDARTDGHLWAETYDVQLRDVFAVQEQIAREVVRTLQVELGDQANRMIGRRGTRDPVAYELYRRGRYVWNSRTQEAHHQAFDYFRQAIARDSNYAEPYAGLADAYLTAYQLGYNTESEAETYARIKWAAERALALHDQLADAHTAFAVSLWSQHNWPGAEREFRRALQLNPGDANARGWYSQLLVGMGRLKEALRESDRAREMDPFAIAINSNAARNCYVLRDYDCAIERHGRSLELSSEWVTAYADRAVIYSLKGQHDAAIRDVSKARELWPRSSAVLADFAYVLARARRETEAREYLRRAKLEAPDPFHVGRAHAVLGEADSAFAWFERSRWEWPRRAIRSDPALDPVRGDPRFARLSLRVDREMGLR